MDQTRMFPMETLSMEIGGMSCGHCVAAVRRALDEIPGVEVREVRVGAAELAYDPALTDPERIRAAIHAEGYQTRDR
jgi:copper chaperone